MARVLVTERTVVDAAKAGKKSLHVPADAIVTPAAKDRAHQLGLLLEGPAPASSPSPAATQTPTGKPESETVAVGSDHGGFQLKEILKTHLTGMGCQIIDVGTHDDEACDYPDFAYAVAQLVATGKSGKGIMIDSVGIASAMVANKVPGIRAACCHDSFTAHSSREHNNANVLTLGGKVIGTEMAKSIVGEWLRTPYAGGRHEKRLAKITDIEKKYVK